MTLQQFAELRNLTYAKAKKFCRTVLGTVVETLTDEQIQRLDAHLVASSQALLPQSKEIDDEESVEIVAAISQIPEKSIDQVIEVIGVSTLKKNANLYHRFIHATIAESLNDTAQYLRKMEDTQASMVAATYERMTRNLAAVYAEIKIPIEVKPEAVELTEDEKEWLELQLKMM